MSDYVLKDAGIKALVKSLKSAPRVKVGILGGGARAPINHPADIGFEELMRKKTMKSSQKQKSDDQPTNAEVGAAHEFGTTKLPIRSFLRVPLTEHLEEYLKNAGAFDKETMERVLKSGSFDEFMTKVGLTAENVVADAFDTGGFGKWPRWFNGYHNNTGMILVDTQQLRNSITSEVK